MHRDIDVLNEEMVAAGVRVYVGGLLPVGGAKSLRMQPGGKVFITDGPYLETRSTSAAFGSWKPQIWTRCWREAARPSWPAARRLRCARSANPAVDWQVFPAKLNQPEEIKGESMRKLRIIEHISLDGVIQAPGGPREDGDYPYGGWAAPHWDPAAGETIVAAHGDDFDLLLGRRTYDIWSGYWPQAPRSPMADAINSATKYIATHRPQSLGWGPVESLGTDIIAGVRRAKAIDGPHLIVWGSSTVTPVLLEHQLADEVLLLVFPVLLGKGKRIFADGTPPRELALVRSKAASSGVIISTYKPSGPLRTGTMGEEA